MNPANANAFAYFALVAWFPLTWLLFAKLPAPTAASLGIVGGALFLPELVEINLPLVPDLNKVTIPTLAALVGCLFAARERVSSARPLRGIDRLLLVLLIADVGTWLTNSDVVPAAPPRPGLTWYDSVEVILEHIVVPYATFFVGRAVFRGAADARALLQVCLKLALVYTVFCLIELRMSPQFHVWFYGFHQHEFIQAMRGNGYRPMVFMGHGLLLARFMLAALLSGVLLARAKFIRGGMVAALFWLAVVFVACKSMGAIVLGIFACPLMLFARSTSLARVAMALAIVVITYPVLRASGLFPADDLVQWSSEISEQRAASLEERFDNEEALLTKARQRIVFGWGGYGRGRVFDETGRDRSVSDGEWIIVLGTQGLVGFLAWYGFYLGPIFLAVRQERRLRSASNRLLVGGLALVVSLLALDTLPNASGSLPHFFWSGALYGIALGLPREERLARLRALRARRAGPLEAAA